MSFYISTVVAWRRCWFDYWLCCLFYYFCSLITYLIDST